MNILLRDLEFFRREYPGAAAFLDAARLRGELESLTARHAHGATISRWETARMQELRGAPCCQEPWFTEILEQITKATS
jgi:hypothetical protein